MLWGAQRRDQGQLPGGGDREVRGQFLGGWDGMSKGSEVMRQELWAGPSLQGSVKELMLLEWI